MRRGSRLAARRRAQQRSPYGIASEPNQVVEQDGQEAIMLVNTLGVAGGLICLALLTGCPTMPPRVYRAPILETVVQQNGGLRIVPERPDGSYMALGTPLRFRVQGDGQIKVLVNGVELPRHAQRTSTSGWYEPGNGILGSGSRHFFWDIAVLLPNGALQPLSTSVQVKFAYDTVTNVVQPELAVTIRLEGRDPTLAQLMPRPSDVFVGNTHNTKQDNRMETSIVARGVTLAGWLVGGVDLDRHDGAGNAGTNASEDWHYDLYLDPDFIERNYTAYAPVEPLWSAWLPGNVVPLIAGPATPIRLLSQDATLPTSRPTASAFTLPGNSVFTVELNAWHTDPKARGHKPAFWVDDPEPLRRGGNAWPFDPKKGVGNLGGRDLAAGGYVIVSGTLWQDTVHPGGSPQDRIGRTRKCFNDRYKGHGGWLEIHPVDSVHRVEAPQLRKHAIGMSACYPEQPNFDTYLKHPDPPPDNTAQLRVTVLVDDRFTTPNAVHTEVVNTACEPPSLRVTANVPGNGSFNATYVLWWEKTNTPRTGALICIPAISPILGGAKD